jgi:hypothetical protein
MLYPVGKKQVLASYGERIMKRTFCVLAGLVLCAAAVVQAQDKQETPDKGSTEGNEIVELLKQVDAAAKAVKAVSYKAHFEITGWMKGQVPTLEGSVLIAGKFEDRFEKFKVDLTMHEGSRTEHYVIGGNGKKYFLIDDQKKVVRENTKPTVLGYTDSWAHNLGMAEFIHSTPFTDEIGAYKLEMKGPEIVGGEECHVVHVVYYKGRGQETNWYVSKKDLLPRRSDRIIVHPVRGRAVSTLTISDLVVDPKIEKGAFDSTVPEGYEKTGDNAPWRRPNASPGSRSGR